MVSNEDEEQHETAQGPERQYLKIIGWILSMKLCWAQFEEVDFAERWTC